MEDILYLREVTIEDARLLFEWANEAECRNNSFHSEPISWEEHIIWLNEKISQSNVEMFVLTDGKENVGQIRLEKQEKVFAVSYSISKQHRQKGYGLQILKLAEDSLSILNDEDYIIYAQVKKDNKASQSIFEHLKYTCDEKENYIEYWKVINKNNVEKQDNVKGKK